MAGTSQSQAQAAESQRRPAEQKTGGSPGGGYAQVAPDQMQKASTIFEDAATRVRNVSESSRQSIDSFEGSWGDDETGQNFAKNYVPSKNGLLEAVEGVAEILDNFAKGTSACADDYRQTEQIAIQNAQMMQRAAQVQKG